MFRLKPHPRQTVAAVVKVCRPWLGRSGVEKCRVDHKIRSKTFIVATLPPPWFPLPPGPENQGENCERLIFFFDEAVVKTFLPGSADSAAETSCSCLDSLRGNVAGAVVSTASRSRKPVSILGSFFGILF